MRPARRIRKDPRHGGALIEFGFIAFLLMMIVFGMFEMDRMLLVMAAVADSARAGVRYAIVHGSDNAPTTAVTTIVKDFASTGMLDPTRLTITGPTYTACSTCSSSTQPGSKVQITVQYPYDPLTTYFSSYLSVNLNSTSEGVIVF